MPWRRAFHDIPHILFLSSAVSWPAKACSGYVILDMIRPVNNVCNAWTFIPCDFNCDSKYKHWFICISILFTYAEADRVEVMSIPPVNMNDQSVQSVVHCTMHCWWVYKNCAIELAPILTHLINKVVNNGTPPSAWLKALVTPVPKKTPPIDFSHLRPISVTPIKSCVTERLIVSK